MEAVWVDKAGNLARIDWHEFSRKTQKSYEFNSPCCLKEYRLTKKENEADYFGQAFESKTRLIGFRSSKDSESSTQIKSLQAIYFSVDEAMCNRLVPISNFGLFDEAQTNMVTADQFYEVI